MPTKAVVSKVLGVERGSGVKVDFSFYEFLIGAIRQWQFSDNVFGSTLALCFEKGCDAGVGNKYFYLVGPFCIFFWCKLLLHTPSHVIVMTSCPQLVVCISFVILNFTGTSCF